MRAVTRTLAPGGRLVLTDGHPLPVLFTLLAHRGARLPQPDMPLHLDEGPTHVRDRCRVWRTALAR
jgi:hypothetical protein